MSNILNVEVTSLSSVLALYDKIKIYRSATVDGTFVEITDASTRLTLNAVDTLYSYIDSSGLSTDYYKTSYFNSGSSTESTISAAVAATVSTQLLENMEVVVILSADIADTDGNTLGTDYEFSYFSTMTPFYSNIRRIRLEIGSFIQDIADYTVAIAILEASIMADVLSALSTITDSVFFNFARKEYTTCKAAQILLDNTLGAGGLKSKTLDNFSVTYDSSHGDNMLNKIADCIARWEAEVVSGGHAVQTPVMVIKGSCDPDAPHVGRMWEHGPYSSKDTGSNQKYKPTGSRRYIGGWFPGGRRR